MKRRLGAAARAPSVLVVGAVVVAALGASALLAPVVAPHDPALQLDPPAARHLPPGSRRSEVRLASGERWLAKRVERVPEGLRIERLGETRTVSVAELVDPDADGLPRRHLFLLGTDGFGRDLWSRLLWAGRASLSVGALAAALAMGLGLLVGGLAGLAGGAVDAALMRLVDALLAFPRLFLVIVVAALFEGTGTVLVLVLGATGWMGAARLVRAEILSLKRRDFVLAARGVGQAPLKVLGRHLLPNALTPVLVDAALRTGDIILVEAALSYIGLGVQQPTPSWGNMIAEGAPVLASAWWISAFPGVAIAVTVIAIHLLADGVREWLDPRAG